MTLLLGFVLGLSAGMRSMTPVALVAWAAQLGWPDLRQTSLAFMAAPVTSWVFTVFACMELVFDKLPFTPSRLGAGPLGARVLMGALCAATVSAATHPSIVAGVSGAIAGALGGVAGAFAGYHVRRHLTMNVKLPALPVAFGEDCVAICIAALAISRLL
jgi:uncharacterized membrane protein